ncbi:carbon-nitrogen hydrolase [Aspergillus heteromorphus CBS 117.55]|uniref:nitrilase n=1 Tax=Aspergillus heteromorphus CBS 117.55 TaxID=1448321 RepID=A0A317WJY4_9EURO|nr:carbon-nitrogen hydrolase [Aspergillus heteromorphus CBS 117.55]PWY86639.1 carbon-nitrogen hydrolase [Aspergillus heteromorphus CBS 117.55]
MPSKTVRVAVTQAEPAWLDLEEGVSKTCELIAEAARNKAVLIAFPECWIPGYPCWIWSRLMDVEMNVRYIKNSLRLDSPEMSRIQQCARTHSIAVSLGFSENADNSVYIAQVLIGPDGEIRSHRRKMKPTHMERTIFGDASGECFASVAELPFARVGALSCWEHIQPLLKFQTLSQGEDIHVSAWPSLTPHSGGSDLWSMSAEGCQSLSQTYAIESQTFVMHCTALITEKGVNGMKTAGGALMSSPGGGSSAVFGPDGRKLTEPVDATTETIIYADLDMDQIVATKMFADGTGHYSRPDLMQLNVCKKVKKMVVYEEEMEVAGQE